MRQYKADICFNYPALTLASKDIIIPEHTSLVSSKSFTQHQNIEMTLHHFYSRLSLDIIIITNYKGRWYYPLTMYKRWRRVGENSSGTGCQNEKLPRYRRN